MKSNRYYVLLHIHHTIKIAAHYKKKILHLFEIVFCTQALLPKKEMELILILEKVF